MASSVVCGFLFYLEGENARNALKISSFPFGEKGAERRCFSTISLKAIAGKRVRYICGELFSVGRVGTRLRRRVRIIVQLELDE